MLDSATKTKIAIFGASMAFVGFISAIIMFLPMVHNDLFRVILSP